MEQTSLCDKMIDRNLIPKRKKKRKLSGLDLSNVKQGELIVTEAEKSNSSLKKRLKEDIDDSSNLKGHDGHYFECEECHHGGNLLCCDSCPRTYHAGCLSPPRKNPTEKWSCPKCCERKEEKPLVTKDTILRKSRSKSMTQKAKAMHSIPSHGKTSLSKRSSLGSNKSSGKSEDTSPGEVSAFVKKSSFSHIHSSSMKSNPSADSILMAGVSVIADSKTKRKSASLSQRNSSAHEMIHSLVKLPKATGIDNFSDEEQDVHKYENSGGKFDLPAVPSSRTLQKNKKMVSKMRRNKRPKSDMVKHAAVCVSNDTTADDSPCPESSGSPPKCNSADKMALMSNTKKEIRLPRSQRKKKLETSPHVASSLSLEVEGVGKSVENKMIYNEKISYEVQQVDRILGCRVRSRSSYIDRADGIAISQAENQADGHSESLKIKLQHSNLTTQENYDQLDDCCVDNSVIYLKDSEFNMDDHQRNATNSIAQNTVGDVSNESDADFVTNQHKGMPNIIVSSDSQSSIAHCKVSELPEGSDSSDVVKEEAAKNSSKGSTHVEYYLSENFNGHHTPPFTDSSIIYEPKDIHMINTIIKFDQSAENVRPNQPVEDLRPGENDLIFNEFLVKWVGKSNVHNSWISEEQLKLLAKRKLENYKAKYGTAVINICEDQWCQPQRIIAVHKSDTGGEALVKWNGLSYDECTWENIDENADQNFCRLISEFEQFETQTLDNDTRHDIVKSEIRKVLSLTEQPKELKGGLLFPHQLEALNWLRRCWYKSKNVILADEMGLGKTVSACSFISSLYVEFKVKLPCLVLVPLSTMPNWLAEFTSWAPHLNVVEYHGSAKARSFIRLHEWHASVSDRSCKRTKSYKFNVLLTTYEMILADSFHLRGVPWELLVVDEGHRLKNSGSKLFSLLNSFSFQHRVLLTGTPLQNNIGEMYNLLNFLQPASFPSLSAFEEKFNDLTTAEKVDELKKLVAPHMLRRLKKDAMQNIPPKTERLVPVELTSVQAEYYRAMLTKNYQVLRNIGKGVAQQSMLNIVMQLRKICNHPYLIPGTEPESGSMEFLQEMRIKASAKLALLHSMLKILHKDGHRVLIFSQMTKLLDILEDYLAVEFGHGTYERVDGSVSVTDRQAAIARFNKDKTRFVFLLSTRSCGLGINLATADTVVIYDSDFNPHADIQAMNRAHRIGQSKRLLVYRLVVRASVEERILQLAKKKLMLDQLFVNKSGSQKEVEDILRWGTEELFGDCDDTNDQVSKDISITKAEDTSFREHKHRRRLGGLGDVYKDKCTDGGAKTVWDENSISKLLDRSDLQASVSENTDGDLDSDLLGSVKSLDWNDEQLNGDPVGTEVMANLAGDGCEPSALKELNSNTVAEENEWDRLLRDRWGKYQLEEEATLGRGKRLRKAVSYRETFASIPTVTLIENVNEEEPAKEYSPAGRALREKYMKLRARQKERISRRHTVEVQSSGEGPESSMQSPDPDSNELQCADSNLHSENSSELDPLAAKRSDYSTSKLGRTSKHDYRRYHGSHLSLSVRSQRISSDTAPPNCVPSSSFLPVLGLCAPNASRRNLTARRNLTSRILNSPFKYPTTNHDQRRTSIGLPEFPFAPVITGETSTSKNVAGQETTDLSLLTDTPEEALHHRMKNTIPHSYFPFGPPPLPTSGKFPSDFSENLGASFSSFREKMGLPNVVSDEVALKFAIQSGCSMKLQTDNLPNLSLCSNMKVENGCGKDLPNVSLWQSFEPQFGDALKQKQVMADLPSMLNLGPLQTGHSIPENHKKVLDNIMIKSRTDGQKFLKRRLKLDAWSEDELDALWIGVRRHGKGNWDAIARDPKLKILKHRSVEELLSKWNEEQHKIMDAPLPPPKMSKSAAFLGLSDGMMARALHCSKFASPGTELPKFRSHLTDIQLGLGDMMPTFPFLEPSSHSGAASESLPLLQSLQSVKLEPNSIGNFFVGPAERFGRDNLPLEQSFTHSFYSGGIGASGMNFSSSCSLQQDDDVSARNKRMKLPSLLEKSLSYLRESQSFHSEESRMGQLCDVKTKQVASLVDDIPDISKENKLPHWLREAVSAPRPLEAALPPSISAISHSIHILFGENKFTIPPFIIPGAPTSLPKDPRKRLRKKRKLNRFQHTIPENSSPTGNTDVIASCSNPAKSPLMGASSPSAPPPRALSYIPPSPSLAENISSSAPRMPFSIPPVPTLFSCKISSAPLMAPSSIPIPPSLLPSFTTSSVPMMPSSLPPVPLMLPFKFRPSLPMMSSTIHQSQSSAPSIPSAVLPASTFLLSSSQSSSLMFGSVSPVSSIINCSIPADSPLMSCTSPLAPPPLTGYLPGLTRIDTGIILPSLNLNLNFPTSSYGTQGMQSHAIPSPSPAACMDHTPSLSDTPITNNQNLVCSASDNPEYSQDGVDLIGDFNYTPYETEGSYEITCRLPGEMEC